MRQLGPIRTLDEIDSEINAMIESRFMARQAVRNGVLS
jgi:hypothetical protein